MICTHCKADKSPHLFFPSQLAEGGRHICRKCCAEIAHYEFGNRGKMRKNWVAINRVASRGGAMDRVRKEIRNDDMRRLIEARKERLAKQAGPS